VFGRNLTSPFSGYSKAKTELDAVAKVKGFVVHDLRRTGATRMGEEGALPHVVEAVLNHVSGARKGVAGTYNKAQYLKQKREALDLLAAHVLKVVA
jgi:integrase